MIVRDVKLRLGEDERKLPMLCEKRLRAPCRFFRILKKSLDARDKSDIRWVYTAECSFSPPEAAPPRVFERIGEPVPRVYIAGAGPAGLFCALRLTDYGFRPVLLERGKCVEERIKDTARFCAAGALDPESNVQFGEGGAGTFSDGKLATQTNSPLNREVLDIFLRFGAPEEIGYLSKPHIGSDKLIEIIPRMREEIVRRGGEVRFSAKLTDFTAADGALSAVFVNGAKEEADALVLAVGHSARDTFERLYARGLYMEQKEFAVGVRIEHLQEEIGRAQYGGAYRSLPPADYKLVSHASDRAVFTFCMCPGGSVIASASEEGGVAVNGMSLFARAGKNGNSALVVQVKKEDFASEHPLAGIAFQRKLERAAFAAAGGGYRAPVQLAGDFLRDRESDRFGSVTPTYAPSVSFAPLRSYLPPSVTQALKTALPDMEKRLKGFSCPDAVLTGVESRTSSPVRIVRDQTMQANVRGIYPCGEGCGYAGGITSAAADGLRTAEAIARRYLAGGV